jgi:phage terminase large subunit GpA-like protein
MSPPFDGPDGYAAFCRAAAAAIRPRVQLYPSQWAEQRRKLSSESSAEAGRWKNARVPYLPAIMDALDRRHPAWLVVFMANAQSAKSEAGLNWAGHTIDEDPGPLLALFPGANLGKSWVRLRLNPMIANAPTLRAKVPLGRRSDKGDTLMQKIFPDGHITVGSTYIPTDASSKAIAKLLIDDVDRFQKAAGAEGDMVEMAIMRLSTFSYRKKCFINSSPGIESLSIINPWWKQSSQGHYHVPCPHCDTKQPLVWENLRWPEGKPKEAQYACAHCGAFIAEHHKTEMLARGEWRHTYSERADEIVGFHSNCLYTPTSLGFTWAENAAAFERAKHDPEKLKVFTNTRLGETHKDPHEKLDWELLHNRGEPFKLRQIAPRILILTCGVDVQKDRVELQILGWGRNERATTIDYQVITGDPTREELWSELDEYLALELENSFGVKMRLACTLIDSNYLTDDVLRFTRPRKSRNIFASRGSNIMTKQAIGRPTHTDVKSRGKSDRRGAERYEIGVSALKRTLYERLRADSGVAKAEQHVRFSDQLSEEYFRGLASEVFDPHKRRWVQVYERNESLDTFILAMAAAMHHSVGVHKLDEIAWQRFEQLYQPAAKPSVEAKPEVQRLPGRLMPTPAVVGSNWIK